MKPKVYIIILNWNGKEDTLKCLNSVYQIDYPNYDIVVIDNGSQDDSVECIKNFAKDRVINFVSFNSNNFSIDSRLEGLRDFPSNKKLVLILNEKNLGFARGNNIGIRFALENGADWVLILNNDTVVPPDFLTKLIEFTQYHKDVGLLGPKLLDFDGSDWQWCVKDRLTFLSMICTLSPLRRLIKNTRLYRSFFAYGDKPFQVYAVWGSCMLFKKDLLKEIGFFDENTFIYWEEFIIAEKIRKTDFKTYFVPNVVIYHKLGTSVRKLGKRKVIEDWKSQTYFIKKYMKFNLVEISILRLLNLFRYIYIKVKFRNTDHPNML